jgi:hypothetical protein
VDAQRNYSDESERWYGGDRGYGASGAPPEWDPRGGDDRYGQGGGHHAEENYRVPEPRGSEPGYEQSDRYGVELGRPVSDPGHPAFDPSARPVSDPGRAPFDQGRPGDAQTGQLPPLGPRSGEPLPPIPPGPAGVPRPAEGVRRPTGPASPVGDGVYRSRRPAAAILFGLLAALFELPALRVLLSGAFADQVSAAGVLAGTFLIVGLPIFAMGMYALVTGAGRLPASAGDRPWLRPPLAYVTVALALFLAAGLAA